METSRYIKQAGTFGPFLQSIPCYAMTWGMRKIFGKRLSFPEVIIFYSNNYGAVYFSSRKCKEIGDYYLDNLKQNFIKRKYQKWLLDLKKLENLGKKILEEKRDGDFRLFYNLYVSLWAKSIVVEVYDEDIYERILKLAESHNVKINLEEIPILTQPKYVSIPLLFESKLIEILNKKEDPNKLIKKYYFLDVNYLTAPDLNLKERIKEIQRKGLKKEIKRTKKIIEKINKNYKKRQKLSRHLPMELKRCLDFFALTVKWRDIRKKMHQIGGYYTWKYIIKKIRVQDAFKPYLMVQDYFNKQYLNKNYLKILAKRKNGSLLMIDNNGNINWIYNKNKIKKIIQKLEGIKKIITEIKGNIANKGKIKGIVKIVNSSKDFKKIQKGNILVASMTRPEYLPVIKLASAIVTDEGGLTSHAAIISRELGKPCIIGTKIATKVLRDGDLVEVDANKGMVKVLKKKKM